MESGGYEYYMKYRRGQHELRKILENDDVEYEVVFTGTYEKCIEMMEKIKARNLAYENYIY